VTSWLACEPRRAGGTPYEGRKVLRERPGREKRVRSAAKAAISVSCMLVLAVLACSGDGPNCPDSCRLPSGRAVVDASVRVDEQGHLYFQGFSFCEGSVVRVPSNQWQEPDFLVMFMTGSQGDIQGLLLVQPDLIPAFHHVDTGETPEEGRIAFDGTICIPADAYLESLGGPVRPYQVWAIKTHGGKFGKILVTDTFFCSQSHDSAGITITRSYGEITFDWQYQPDGSRCFE
jgi:hypothetical protein